PFAEAWRLFGAKNGAPSFDDFRASIRRLRGSDPAAVGALPLGCVVLREATLLPRERWIPRGSAQGWSRNIVNDKTYDLLAEPGRPLHRLLADLGASTPPELAADSSRLLDADDRRLRDQPVAARDGRGATSPACSSASRA